ncbi:protein FAM200C-like [Hemitrygon akajei]|uniref:protein FAM200C-like n=1 Tax=Hemitrygon akajei TaxID=2704970 RepID=UPI003BF995D2
MDKYIWHNLYDTEGDEALNSNPAKNQKLQKVRQHNVTYLEYGFIPFPSDQQHPMFLICNTVLSNEAMKPSGLQAHFRKRHPEKTTYVITQFQKIKEAFEKCCTLESFGKKAKNDLDSGLIASYNISTMIAKCGKSHTISERLIMPAVPEVLSTVLKMDTNIFKKSIPLSNNSVAHCIDEMSDDFEYQLYTELQKSKFGIQLDESTVQNNEALLMAHVWFIKNDKVYEDILFCKKLKININGKSIYEEHEMYIEDRTTAATERYQFVLTESAGRSGSALLLQSAGGTLVPPYRPGGLSMRDLQNQADLTTGSI